MQVYEGKVCAPGSGKIAIIVSRFNKSITERLLEGALTVLRKYSVPEDDLVVVWVPGAFELPTLAERFAIDEEYQAVICLGCVIKGETSHDQHINRAVSMQLARIGAENGIPVIFGMLTCNTTEQALARSGQNEQSHDKALDPTVGNKGAEAAEAALEMLHLLEQLPELVEEDVFSGASIAANAAAYRHGDYDENPSFDSDSDFEESEEDDDSWFVPGREKPAKKSSDKPFEKPAKSGKFGKPRDDHRKSYSPKDGKKFSAPKKNNKDKKFKKNRDQR